MDVKLANSIKILIMSQTDRRPRGARELHLPDWPYGAVGRRLVLEALLLDEQPGSGWSKSELERRARSRQGGIDKYLAGILAWGIASPEADGSWHRAEPSPTIASPLSELLALTRQAEDRPILPLPKRRYERHR
jgi:hypothetical protein